MRNELKIGIGAFVLFLFLNRYTETPVALLGVILVIALLLEIIGLMPEKAYKSWKNWKARIFKRNNLTIK